MQTITSRHNPVVKAFREAARGRPPDGVMLLDGEHLVSEAIEAGVPIGTAAFASRLLARPGGPGPAPRLARRLAERGARVFSVSDNVMEAMSPVRAPSGVIALAEFVPPALDRVFGGAVPLVPVLAAVQDPGNLGAIVRTAEAAGATGLIACLPSADPYGWKALRGAMGSTFRVPVPQRVPLGAAIEEARRRGLRIAAAVPRGGTPAHRFDFRGPVAILLGGEGAGLEDEALARADDRLTIPMRPPVESLNVAVSAAILLYEAARQRDLASSAQPDVSGSVRRIR